MHPTPKLSGAFSATPNKKKSNVLLYPGPETANLRLN
jgi:hypothetical protein